MAAPCTHDTEKQSAIPGMANSLLLVTPLRWKADPSRATGVLRRHKWFPSRCCEGLAQNEKLAQCTVVSSRLPATTVCCAPQFRVFLPFLAGAAAACGVGQSDATRLAGRQNLSDSRTEHLNTIRRGATLAANGACRDRNNTPNTHHFLPLSESSVTMRMQQDFGRLKKVVAMACLLAVAGVAPSAWAQFPTPEVTKEHKMLKADAGVWDAEMKIWMGGPDAEPTVTKGVERNRMLGDYWLISDFTTDLGGQPFAGHGQNGYDPVKKKFVGTWIDSMSANISTMEGTYDEKSGELTMMMTSIDPTSGQEVKSKSVSKRKGDNTRVFTMYMQAPGGDGTWVKSMEVTYTRRPERTEEKK
jgi:hypothetical protein